MINKIKDFFNVIKYKKRANTIKNKYDTIIDNKIKDKETIILLQSNIISLLEKVDELENSLLEYKKKEVKR